MLRAMAGIYWRSKETIGNTSIIPKRGKVTIAGKSSIDLPTKTAHTIFKQAQIPWPKGKR
jgi:hypothetical protein